MKKFLQSYYLSKNTFIALGVCVALFSLGLVNYVFFNAGLIVFMLLWLMVLVESFLLFKGGNILEVKRKLPLKLSNGDLNTVELSVKNNGKLKYEIEIIEELPKQLQIRDWSEQLISSADSIKTAQYQIFPKQRGAYEWGKTHLKIKLWKWGFVYRKDSFDTEKTISCYPSFEQFNRIPVKAIVSQFAESSEKCIRKIGQSLEFEQIKEYAQGDDYRHINWKSSAKKGSLMVNQYQDERSQDIYCMLDMGRTMRMPFNEQTLLDYSINGILALSKAIITAQDKAGFVGFASHSCDFLPAKRDMRQFGKINDVLYNLDTQFLESNFELLYKFTRINIKQRSLLVIFTNFDSENAMYRQLPYLKSLSKYHVVLLVFFENSEIEKLSVEKAQDLKSVYTKTIAQSLLLKNRLISIELQKNGIISLSIKPEDLSLEVINAYINIKKRSLI